MKKCLKLEELTVEQKIGLLLTVREVPRSEEDEQFVKEMIKKGAVGAVQVAPWPHTVKYIKELTDLADYPILIGCDLERGFNYGGVSIPGNMALGAVNSVEDVYAFARLTAKLAKQAGVNMIWSPVVDAADHDRPCSTCRCFCGDRDKIVQYGTAYMQAFYECGVIGTAKHYPSSTINVDTHMTEGFAEETEEQLKEINLKTFRGIYNNLGDKMTGIMSGHQKCPKIDPEYPATLSKKIIGFAREFGFNGLMVTDSMGMVGLIQNYGNEKMLGMAVDAGNDLLLPNYRIPFKQTYNYLLQNYRDGLFTEERLNEAVSRVLKAQEITLTNNPEGFEVTDEERAMLNRIYDNCICEIRQPGAPADFDKNGKHLFVVDCENMYEGSANTIHGEIGFTTWWKPLEIKANLEKQFPNSVIKLISEFPSYVQVEGVCSTAPQCEDVIYLTYCEPRCYQGPDGLTERFRTLIQATDKKNLAVLHFGSPYAMAKIIDVPRLIIGFQHERCVDVALDILTGKKTANGTLPVNIGK